jgi:hypothetical protein
MSHPYKAFMANNYHDGASNSTHKVKLNRQIHLSPVEEHYLKKSLIKNQLISEFTSLSPDYNDTSGLRRFGPPFVPADPQFMLKDSTALSQIYSIAEQSVDIFRRQFPLLRFIFENFLVTFPFIKIHLNKLGPTMEDQSKFWLKIQILFELFKSKKISNSNDRGTISKRKLLIYKIQGLFLTFFNSSIYCFQDPKYFEMDKERRGAYKKLGKFIDAAESEKLKENKGKDDEELKRLEDDFLNMNLSPDNLLNYLDDIDDDEYINGYYVNIIGVSIESETKSSFWGSKDSKYYAFIIHVKTPNKPGWFIKRRYLEFNQLYKDLKNAFPGTNIPELPSKDKQSVQMNNNDESIENLTSNIDYRKSDDSFTDIDEKKFNELFASPKSDSVETFTNGGNEPIQSTGLKSPKISFNGFSKPTFMKSPLLGSPKKNNSSKFEKSFLNSFKKSGWSSPSTPSSAYNSKDSLGLTKPSISADSVGHIRSISINSTNSEVSVDSIGSTESDETNDTFHSADTTKSVKQQGASLQNDKITFPREILRQSLRGFLKFLIHNKHCSKSNELKKFLGDENSKIALTKRDINDIQQRINIDHLRTIQHYKFQNALVDIIKVLEKDVENLKSEIYNEGFSYVFDKIKINKTLHDLCGFNSNISSGSWLNNNLNGLNVLTPSSATSSSSSAPLRGLVRIILLEIASTQYELLVGSDNSMGTLKTIKKLHSVFPYRLVAGVLRFTNPLMMVKRMIDVFTYQMPNVTGGVTDGVTAIGNSIGGMMQGLGLGKWKTEPEKEVHDTNSNKKGRSLLQLIFSGMLGDDLRKLEKESTEICDLLSCYDSENINGEYGSGEIIMERIKEYFTSDDSVVLNIKAISKALGLDIVTTIMLPNNGLKICDDLGSQTINNILYDYAEAKKNLHHNINDENNNNDNNNTNDNDNDNEDNEDIDEEKDKEVLNKDLSLYKLSKRFFFLQLRKYDKESLIELWNEPELMSVIKEIISIFLSPLIELFKKAEVYKYIPIFARYMGELIELCEIYSNDYGQFGRSDIVSELVGLEEKYSEDVYKFIRDMYLNDLDNGDDKLFEGIVEWLNNIVKFLRFVKKERPELMIDLNKLLNDIELNTNEKLTILKSIGKVVIAAEKKRKVLEKMEQDGELQKRKENEERSNDWMKMSRDRKVDGKWDEIHNRVFKVGEAIAGGDEDGGDIYDMIGIDGVTTDNEDFDTDEEVEENRKEGDEKIEQKIKTFQDLGWDVKEFISGYYSYDWNLFLKQHGYGHGANTTFIETSECGPRVATAFANAVGEVFAAYGKS